MGVRISPSAPPFPLLTPAITIPAENYARGLSTSKLIEEYLQQAAPFNKAECKQKVWPAMEHGNVALPFFHLGIIGANGAQIRRFQIQTLLGLFCGYYYHGIGYRKMSSQT